MKNMQSSPLNDLGDRLVTLNDGRFGLRTGLHVLVTEPPRIKSDAADAGPEAASKFDSHPSPDSAEAVLDFIASDETLDRADEVISATGWRLEAYRRNPVFQNAHQYGDILFTLGKALLTEIRLIQNSPVLFQRVQFATDANPMARIAYALYQGKFLNAVSVGFIPIRWENADGSEHEIGRGFCSNPNPSFSLSPSHEDQVSRKVLANRHFDLNRSSSLSPSHGEHVSHEVLRNPYLDINRPFSLSPSHGERAGERGRPAPARDPISTPLPSDGRGVRGEGSCIRNTLNSQPRPRRRYLEQELLEVSAVGIPANPNALQLGYKAGAISRGDLRDLMEMLKEIFGSSPRKQSQLPLGSNPAVTDTHACASGVRNNEAQLLQLARAARNALKR